MFASSRDNGVVRRRGLGSGLASDDSPMLGLGPVSSSNESHQNEVSCATAGARMQLPSAAAMTASSLTPRCSAVVVPTTYEFTTLSSKKKTRSPSCPRSRTMCASAAAFL